MSVPDPILTSPALSKRKATGTLRAIQMRGSGIRNGSGVIGSGMGDGSGVTGLGIGDGSGVTGSGIGDGSGVTGLGIRNGSGVTGSGIRNGSGVIGSGMGGGSGVIGSGMGDGSGVTGLGSGDGCGVTGFGMTGSGRRRMPRGSLTRSSSEKSLGLRSACSATAPLRRATYGPLIVAGDKHEGSLCTPAKFIASPYPSRSSYRRPPKRWRRRRSRPALLGSRSTATTSLPCVPPPRRRLQLLVSGESPRFIEAITYRLGDHITADDAGRYRPPEEVQGRWKEEPIARLRACLVSQRAWGKAEEEQLVSECQERIDAAAERYLTIGPRAPETMFGHLYAELPKVYTSQRDELKGVSHA
jgi:dehydrogenase E1 component